MIALCQYLLKDSEKNINHNIDGAYNMIKSITKASQKIIGRRVVTQFSLLNYYMLEKRPELDVLPIISLLIKAYPEESKICSGILLEKIAESYLRFEPPRIRRNAFHLLLSSQCYASCGLPRQVLRNYKLANLSYSDGWNNVKTHIGHEIAVELGHDNEYNNSALMYSKIIGVGNETKKEQIEYIEELKRIIDTVLLNNEKVEANNLYQLNMLLPSIDDNTVQVLSCNNALSEPEIEEQSVIAKQAWMNINDSIKVEYDAYTAGNTRLKRRRRAPGYYPQAKIKDRVVNEPIYISFNIINPLDLQLEIKDMKLIGNIKGDDVFF